MTSETARSAGISGEALKAARNARGWTQTYLAEVLDTGRGAVASWEKNGVPARWARSVRSALFAEFYRPEDEPISGAELRELRESAGMTVTKLAERLRVSPITVQGWESSPSGVPVARLSRIADILERKTREWGPAEVGLGGLEETFAEWSKSPSTDIRIEEYSESLPALSAAMRSGTRLADYEAAKKSVDKKLSGTIAQESFPDIWAIYIGDMLVRHHVVNRVPVEIVGGHAAYFLKEIRDEWRTERHSSLALISYLDEDEDDEDRRPVYIPAGVFQSKLATGLMPMIREGGRHFSAGHPSLHECLLALDGDGRWNRLFVGPSVRRDSHQESLADARDWSQSQLDRGARLDGENIRPLDLDTYRPVSDPGQRSS